MPLPLHSSSTTDWRCTCPSGRDVEAAQCSHGGGDRHQAGFHVPGTAAVKPVSLATRLERRARPQLLGTLYELIKPGQPAPFNSYPYIALGVLVVAAVYGAYLNARDRTLGDRIGSVIADAD